MKAVDYRPRAAMWSQIGDFIAGKSAVGLIEDYGSPLEYWGWRTIPLWPYTGDTKYARSGGIPVADVFTQHAGKDLFLITDFEELVRQPALEEILKKYPVASRGDGYIIYTIRARD